MNSKDWSTFTMILMIIGFIQLLMNQTLGAMIFDYISLVGIMLFVGRTTRGHINE